MIIPRTSSLITVPTLFCADRTSFAMPRIHLGSFPVIQCERSNWWISGGYMQSRSGCCHYVGVESGLTQVLCIHSQHAEELWRSQAVLNLPWLLCPSNCPHGCVLLCLTNKIQFVFLLNLFPSGCCDFSGECACDSRIHCQVLIMSCTDLSIEWVEQHEQHSIHLCSIISDKMTAHRLKSQRKWIPRVPSHRTDHRSTLCPSRLSNSCQKVLETCRSQGPKSGWSDR